VTDETRRRLEALRERLRVMQLDGAVEDIDDILALPAAPPPELVALVREIVSAYDGYRARGVTTAAAEYGRMVQAIEKVRTALAAARDAGPPPGPEALATAREAAERERDEALEGEHYANGVADLAMKHRDAAEQARDAAVAVILEWQEADRDKYGTYNPATGRVENQGRLGVGEYLRRIQALRDYQPHAARS
jgi:hypothetical protein